jgi:hypothetical protein
MVIVRVPKHDEISLSTSLDAGASGIVIPHCESAEEVKKIIEEAFYRTLFSLYNSFSKLNGNNSSNRQAILQSLDVRPRNLRRFPVLQ